MLFCKASPTAGRRHYDVGVRQRLSGGRVLMADTLIVVAGILYLIELNRGIVEQEA
jgi:hypothetical protein